MHKRTHKTAIAFAATLGLLLLAVPSGAASAETKNARSGDVATSYQLDNSGRFYRIVAGTKCQITDKVTDFKVSQHKDDVAVVYYIRDESDGPNLYGLYNGPTASNRIQCPRAKKELLLSDVKKVGKRYRYSITSNSKTNIVAMALSRSGDFYAWSQKTAALRAENIVDYRMHSKFGVRGASFSRYVGFAMDKNGNVLKLEGKKPQSSSVDRSRRYGSLAQFAKQNQIN